MIQSPVAPQPPATALLPPQAAAQAGLVAQPRPRPAAMQLPQGRAVPQPARPGRMRARHWGLAASFMLAVVVPAAVAAWYLWARAADQYASYLGFSVRREEAASAFDLLGGLAAVSGASSADTDILYEYLHSPGLVAEIDAALDLRAIWSKAEGDPVFAYASPGTIEDLLDHWQRKVRVSYDSGTHLIEVRVLAFAPDDATAIAQAILDRAGLMINALSDVAREDTVRHARTDLAEAEARVATARAALTRFRDRTQVVDPGADVAGQTGLLAHLQEQLAEALIALDLLRPDVPATDHRLRNAEARVSVIEARIAAERRKLGMGEEAGGGQAGDAAYAATMGEYERLRTELGFAEESYGAARAAHDAAVAEARRQGRYLAAHIAPTRAESPRFPQRETMLATLTAFLVLGWATLALVAYALRDRR